ncbi:hypothetical protein TEA_022645 [Camellia sinensis var. sinensis]|uniref:Mannose-1-phosphate guanyltransferase C-terminal domain-containing protein n=1 Tax=Camellia sinensis var. sinensis TaxID=542762 RepID=A0A4S4DN89_CAMSN|nr:hypothetical protein TEA_022645 [Camellia sinensis var. sinensis]
MPVFSHQIHSQIGQNPGFQHSGPPQLHHSQPMFHLGNKPPPSMGPSFPQGQPPLSSQPPPQSVYQVGGSHFGTEFNSQVGSSMQPERAPAWIPGLADNAMGSQLPGPPLMLSLSQGLFLSPPLLCETDDGFDEFVLGVDPLTPFCVRWGFLSRAGLWDKSHLMRQIEKSLPSDFVRLDQDILSPLAGKKQLYTYETMDFWEQIKTPGMSLKCSGLYLAQFRFASPHVLASGDGTKNASIIGDVYIHPSAKVHPTAKIGPNVSISANARIGPGVRLISCIILDDVEIKENAVVMHAIVGWKSSIGRWSRAGGDHNAKLGITILGEAVTVEDEVVVINSIVLPNKTLNISVQEEILL